MIVDYPLPDARLPRNDPFYVLLAWLAACDVRLLLIWPHNAY
jgi:hypothetical protein